MIKTFFKNVFFYPLPSRVRGEQNKLFSRVMKWQLKGSMLLLEEKMLTFASLHCVTAS